MTQYLNKSFSVAPGLSAAYRDNYDAIFGPKDAQDIFPSEEPVPPLLALLQEADSELSSQWSAHEGSIHLEGDGYVLRVIPEGSALAHSFGVYLEVVAIPTLEVCLATIDTSQQDLEALQDLECLHLKVAGIIDQWVVGVAAIGGLEGTTQRPWAKTVRRGLITLAFQVKDDLLRYLPGPGSGQPSPEARLEEPPAP